MCFQYLPCDPKAEECCIRRGAAEQRPLLEGLSGHPQTKGMIQKGDGYFWNYHDKGCNEKLTAGLDKKEQVGGKEQKSFPDFFAKKL